MPKRQREESLDWWPLKEREERLLPLIGFRIWPEEARIECVLNLIEGQHLVRPFALKSDWSGFAPAFNELLEWANPLFQPLSLSIGESEQRQLRPRELREQPSEQEERCGVRRPRLPRPADRVDAAASGGEASAEVRRGLQLQGSPGSRHCG